MARDIIDSKDELMERLDVIDLKNISDNPQIQKEFVKLSPELSPELLKDLIVIVPDLTKVFTETIKCMDNIGKSLEETKRLRWEVIRDISKSNVLTGKEVLEAIELLKEIEKNEYIDWESIFKHVFNVVGALAVVAIIIFAVKEVLEGILEA